MKRPAGQNVPVPTDIVEEIKRRDKDGKLNQLTKISSVSAATLYGIARHGQRSMNEHYLERLRRALAGESLPPLKRSKGKSKALVKRKSEITPAIVQQLSSNQFNPDELRGIMNGLMLGVHISRQTVLEYLAR